MPGKIDHPTAKNRAYVACPYKSQKESAKTGQKVVKLREEEGGVKKNERTSEVESRSVFSSWANRAVLPAELIDGETVKGCVAADLGEAGGGEGVNCSLEIVISNLRDNPPVAFKGMRTLVRRDGTDTSGDNIGEAKDIL
jgi:hypothetical protein